MQCTDSRRRWRTKSSSKSKKSQKLASTLRSSSSFENRFVLLSCCCCSNNTNIYNLPSPRNRNIPGRLSPRRTCFPPVTPNGSFSFSTWKRHRRSFSSRVEDVPSDAAVTGTRRVTTVIDGRATTSGLFSWSVNFRCNRAFFCFVLFCFTTKKHPTAKKRSHFKRVFCYKMLVQKNIR